MKRLRFTYREVVEVVALMPEVKGILGLERLPHFTTLQKFFNRVRSAVFDVLLRRAVELCGMGCTEHRWIAIDGTGHSSQYASVYYGYTQRGARAPQRQQRKRYTKNHIAVETGNQVIIAHRVARGPRHDAKDAVSLIRKTKAVHPIGYSMDKAYDSEEIWRVVHEEVGAACMIPLRKGAKSGTYRRATREAFDEGLYHRRNLVETVFSVEKRVFDDVNNSRSDRLRNRESKFRNVCYNVYWHVKVVIIVVVRGFYRARITSLLQQS
jgi:hypothetical protein